MKKLILAFVALALAFAISSCCDQSYCPNNMKCSEKGGGEKRHLTDGTKISGNSHRLSNRKDSIAAGKSEGHLSKEGGELLAHRGKDPTPEVLHN